MDPEEEDPEEGDPEEGDPVEGDPEEGGGSIKPKTNEEFRAMFLKKE